jgi:hypothetical protein
MFNHLNTTAQKKRDKTVACSGSREKRPSREETACEKAAYHIES